MNEEHYFFVPMWFFVFGLIILGLIGCSNPTKPHVYEKPFFHTCPEFGHGNCPICYDPYRNKNEKTIAFDR